MKACVLHGIGDIRCEERPTPTPGEGEVLVRVRACGVCGSDIPRVFVKGTYRFPTIPGHEFAGTVEAVGFGTDPSWVNRRVAVFPLIPCMQCDACRAQRYAQCADYGYLGSRSDGAFAEYVCAPAWNLLPLPDNVSHEEGALAEPAAVARHAARLGNIQPNDTVLIFGAGPIGLLVAQWVADSGARNVLLVDIDDARLEFARGLGFNTFNSQLGDVSDWVKGFAANGADVVIEATGVSPVFEQVMAEARPFGTVVLLGNPSGPMQLTQAGYWHILRKELTVKGSWNSIYKGASDDDWVAALDAIASRHLNARALISHKVALDQLPATLDALRDHTAFFCKVLCTP